MAETITVDEPVKTGFGLAAGAFLFTVALVATAAIAGVVLSSRTGN
jgi:hypothetical protein